jgi:hypothetical protein
MPKTDFDFDAAYKVEGYRGIAWYVVGYVKDIQVNPVYDEDDEYTGFDDWEEVEDRSKVVCIMVGDDRKFTFDIEDLAKLNEEEYCPSCGQIGCGWGH